MSSDNIEILRKELDRLSTENKRLKSQLNEPQVETVMNRFDNYYKHLYKDIVETAGEGIWVTDINNNTLFVNGQLTHMLGYSAAEMDGKPTLDFLDPCVTANSQENQEIVNGEKHHFTTKYVRKNGSAFWATVSASSIRDSQGNVVALLNMLTDVTLNKKAADELQLSEHVFSIAFRKNPIALALTNLSTGLFLDINDAYLTLLGYTRNEVIGRTALDLNIYDHPGERAILLEQLKEKNSIKNAPINLRTRDHTLLTTLVSIEVLEHNGEEILLTIIEDITKLSNIEDSLRIERDKLTAVIHNMGVGVILADMSDNVYTLNKAALAIHGFENADDAHKKLSDYSNNFELYFPSGKLMTLDEWPVSRAKRGETVMNAEASVKKISDGSYRYISYNATPILDSNNHVGIIIITLADQTDQHKTIEKLQVSERRFRILADNIVQFAWMGDPQGNLFWYNQRWLDYTGTTFEEVEGWGWKKVHHPDYVDLVATKFKKAIEKGAPWEDTFPLRSKDGEYRWFLSRAVPIRDTKGDIIKWFGTNTDITDLRQTQEDLKKAKEKAEENDNLKTAFLANMSHEIRTPMTGILGFTELLKSSELTEKQKHSYLNVIEASGKRMLQIINDLIDISKIEAKQVEMKSETTDIKLMLEELLQFFIPEANKKEIYLRLNNNVPNRFNLTQTDKTKLCQVITNLLKNALKFTSKGLIEFGCELQNNHYRFFVKDTGPGIPAEKQEIIFERFRQGDISWSDKSDGAGLGLSISKAYVELLGGNIFIESQLGEGSLFYFTIPVVHAKHDAPKNILEEENSKALLNKKILIAEDEEGIYLLIKEILHFENIDTVHAWDGNEAIEILKNNNDIDLILMDSKMPNLDGMSSVKIIRTFNKEIPIISLSAYSTEADKQRALSAGCNDYLVKPMSRKDLFDKIRIFLK